MGTKWFHHQCEGEGYGMNLATRRLRDYPRWCIVENGVWAIEGEKGSRREGERKTGSFAWFIDSEAELRVSFVACFGYPVQTATWSIDNGA